MADTTKSDVFKFMHLRAAQSFDDKEIYRRYIKDEILVPTTQAEENACIVHHSKRQERNFMDKENIANNNIHYISSHVFEQILSASVLSEGYKNHKDDTKNLIDTIIKGKDYEIRGLHFLDLNNTDEKTKYWDFNLLNTTNIIDSGKCYIVPERIDLIGGFDDRDKVLAVQKIIEKHLNVFNKSQLIAEIEAVICSTEYPNLCQFVFNGSSGYTHRFMEYKNWIYETLYKLYILRRRKDLRKINFENIMRGLQVMHVIEWLATDQCLHFCHQKGCLNILGIFSKSLVQQNTNNNRDVTQGKLSSLSGAGRNKGMRDWQKSGNPNQENDNNSYQEPSINGFSLQSLLTIFSNLFKYGKRLFQSIEPVKYYINDVNDLKAYFNAKPIIHLGFARLFHYVRPFNDLKAIGIGDLKVVKQWLVGYEAGEISHIHNVMKNEVRERNHRRFEKSDDTFISSSEQNNFAERESQSTDKNEIKTEANRTLKDDMNRNIAATAGTNLEYAGQKINTSINGGVASNHSAEDAQKSATSFARDVMSKAIERVESKTSQSRSSTHIFESEENNKQGFNNTGISAKHNSGIFRWVDKRYKAQVYTFDQRLMYEFIIPEPAKAFVHARFDIFENFDLVIPNKPGGLKIIDENSFEIQLKNGTKITSSSQVNDAIYNELKEKYDLSSISFISESSKNEKKEIPIPILEDISDGDSKLKKVPKSYTIPENFLLEKVEFEGEIIFDDVSPDGWLPTSDADLNKVTFSINSEKIGEKDGKTTTLPIKDVSKSYDPAVKVENNQLNVEILVNDGKKVSVTMKVFLVKDANEYITWQTQVFNKIKGIEIGKIKATNSDSKTTYDKEMIEYRSALKEIENKNINDLFLGGSEEVNKAIIREELKRDSLAFITKAFDSDISDNAPISDFDKIMQTKNVISNVVKQSVDEHKDPAVRILKTDKDTPFVTFNIEEAIEKGEYVQFLEQAFEWERMAYIFYPYFWASEKSWLDMMHRHSDTDPNMTAFLRAGAARVLVAVTPKYEEAVMHFLATREPFNGGGLPVLGDDLYLPIHEEIKKTQDPFSGARIEANDEPWEFIVPTSLVYLDGSETPLPSKLNRQ